MVALIICRPSGTEDVVRVYAEAATQVSDSKGQRSVEEGTVTFMGQILLPDSRTCLFEMLLLKSIYSFLCGLQEEADELAYQVRDKVHQLAGGVGKLSQ